MQQDDAHRRRQAVVGLDDAALVDRPGERSLLVLRAEQERLRERPDAPAEDRQHPGDRAGPGQRQDDPPERLPRPGAEAGRGLLQLGSTLPSAVPMFRTMNGNVKTDIAKTTDGRLNRASVLAMPSAARIGDAGRRAAG